jgi:hypothetical protein
VAAEWIEYHVYGLEVVPVSMFLPNILDTRYTATKVYLQRGWVVFPDGDVLGNFLPDGRILFECRAACRLEGENIVILEPDNAVSFVFIIWGKRPGWYFDVPYWDGPLPPERGGGK